MVQPRETDFCDFKHVNSSDSECSPAVFHNSLNKFVACVKASSDWAKKSLTWQAPQHIELTDEFLYESVREAFAECPSQLVHIEKAGKWPKQKVDDLFPPLAPAMYERVMTSLLPSQEISFAAALGKAAESEHKDAKPTNRKSRRAHVKKGILSSSLNHGSLCA